MLMPDDLRRAQDTMWGAPTRPSGAMTLTQMTGLVEALRRLRAELFALNVPPGADGLYELGLPDVAMYGLFGASSTIVCGFRLRAV